MIQPCANIRGVDREAEVSLSKHQATQHSWFLVQRDGSSQDILIAAKELFLIVLTCAV